MSVRSCCSALVRELRPPRPRLSAITTLRQPSRLLRPASTSSSSQTPPPTPSTPPAENQAIQSFASALRSRSPSAATDPYAAYGTTEKMYAACSAAGSYTLVSPTTSQRAPLHTPTGEELGYPSSSTTWHTPYALPPTFGTWAQLTFLHLHVLHVRIRVFPAQHARAWAQQLLDHLFYAAEARMADVHGLDSRGVRTRYLKDLFEQWRGAEVSYDEGLVKGDAVLAAAVWRNVFQAREDVDARHLAEIVAWQRRAVRGLAGLSDAEFASGRWKFGVPWEAKEEAPAEGMRRPFD